MVSFRLTGAGPRSASPVVSRIAYQAGLSASGKAVVSEVSVSHQCRPDSAFGDVASGDLDLTRRNVSTTLIRPGLEFRLGVVALVERLWTGQDGRPIGVRLAG